MYRKCFKRLLDIVISAISVVVIIIPMLFIALLIRIKLGAPVLFVQERPGKDERIFKVLKFRTMTDKRDENGNLLPDEIRLTKFGAFLRKSSLDELPQLINILKGDMSLVGPRPLLVEYLPLYTTDQRTRHTVRPGLTNLVAINGRNSVQMEEKLSYDIYYVKNLSFLQDVKIILKTVAVVLGGKGTDLEASDKMTRYARINNDDKDIEEGNTVAKK